MGKGAVQHHPEISLTDLPKLYASFNVESPAGLQDKAMFDILFFMCHPGRDNLRELTNQTFKLNTDVEGDIYIYQAVDELEKIIIGKMMSVLLRHECTK